MPSEAQSRGDSSATAKVPPTLPNEIWLHIADMVDSNDLKKLIGLNRMFFEMGMNEKYEKLSLLSNDPGVLVDTLDQLRSPLVASRVRTLTLWPLALCKAVYTPCDSVPRYEVVPVKVKPEQVASEQTPNLKQRDALLSGFKKLGLSLAKKASSKEKTLNQKIREHMHGTGPLSQPSWKEEQKAPEKEVIEYVRRELPPIPSPKKRLALLTAALRTLDRLEQVEICVKEPWKPVKGLMKASGSHSAGVADGAKKGEGEMDMGPDFSLLKAQLLAADLISASQEDHQGAGPSVRLSEATKGSKGGDTEWEFVQALMEECIWPVVRRGGRLQNLVLDLDVSSAIGVIPSSILFVPLKLRSLEVRLWDAHSRNLPSGRTSAGRYDNVVDDKGVPFTAEARQSLETTVMQGIQRLAWFIKVLTSSPTDSQSIGLKDQDAEEQAVGLNTLALQSEHPALWRALLAHSTSSVDPESTVTISGVSGLKELSLRVPVAMFYPILSPPSTEFSAASLLARMRDSSALHRLIMQNAKTLETLSVRCLALDGYNGTRNRDVTQSFTVSADQGALGLWWKVDEEDEEWESLPNLQNLTIKLPLLRSSQDAVQNRKDWHKVRHVLEYFARLASGSNDVGLDLADSLDSNRVQVSEVLECVHSGGAKLKRLSVRVETLTPTVIEAVVAARACRELEKLRIEYEVVRPGNGLDDGGYPHRTAPHHRKGFIEATQNRRNADPSRYHLPSLKDISIHGYAHPLDSLPSFFAIRDVGPGLRYDLMLMYHLQREIFPRVERFDGYPCASSSPSGCPGVFITVIRAPKQ